jgi:hydrogenase/urease accessory protein HupE
VAVHGLADAGTNVLLRISLADGRQLRALLSAREPDFEVPPRADRLGVAASFFGLGVEHLATGLDHVLFVTGLVCLVRRGRRLFSAITAFTAGHSVTLALAVLGVVRLPSGLVEVGIAGSLVWLALEIVRARGAVASGLLSRRPWLMAFGFGLLHGLGFAGALREAGLPQQEIPLALFTFNLGIEAGQLGLVALLLLAARALRPAPVPWRNLAPRFAAEAIGVLGVFFCLERLGGLLGR